MKIWIVLPCLLAVYAVGSEAIPQVLQLADLDTAELHGGYGRRPSGHGGYGGYDGRPSGSGGFGGHGGYSQHGAGWVRKGRSVGEDQPIIEDIQPIIQDVSDLNAAESHGYAQFDGRGRYSAYGGHSAGNRKGRSVEEDAVVDLETAEHRNTGYGGYPGFSGYGGNRGTYGGNRGAYGSYGNYGGYRPSSYGGYGGKSWGR